MFHSVRSQLTSHLVLALVVLAIFALGCAGAPAAPTAPPVRAAPAQPTAAPAQPTAAPAQPTAAPQPTAVPPTEQALGSNDGAPFSPSNAAAIDRKIIKNAQLALTVQDTPTAIFQITGIASDVGGYVVGSRTFGVGDRTGAQITISVPVDRFEEALNMVRNVALRIDQDITSSAEVTEEFVDLESRLRNAQATAARLRDFLARATTIKETLAVNVELTNIEQQIEQIKGRLNALNARSSFSTIAVDLNEPIPTFEPTHTPTVTPSPTPTLTPTPIVWRPDETLQSATRVQTSLFQGLANVLIWFGVVVLPYLVVALLFGLLVRWFVQRTGRKLTP